ncbi:MAG: hypothetical protein AAB445_02470 [Patescibacteria group bacterium]
MDIAPTTQPTPKKPNSTLNWAILVVVLVVVIAGTIYAITRQEPITNANTIANGNATVNKNTQTNNSNVAVDTSGWATFTNNQQYITVKYPQNYQAKERTSSEGQWVVQFVDSAFVNAEVGVPYIDIQKLASEAKNIEQWTQAYLQDKSSQSYEQLSIDSRQATSFTVNSGSRGYAVIAPTEEQVTLIYVFHSGRSDVEKIGSTMVDTLKFN